MVFKLKFLPLIGSSRSLVDHTFVYFVQKYDNVPFLACECRVAFMTAPDTQVIYIDLDSFDYL